MQGGPSTSSFVGLCVFFASNISSHFSSWEQEYREKLKSQYPMLKNVVSIGNKIVPLVKEGSDVRTYLDNIVQG